MYFISVIFQFGGVPVGVGRIFRKSDYQSLMNVICEIDEFNGRQHNLIRWFNYLVTAQDEATYGASRLVNADKDSRNIFINI